jgi:hypothetical protein
MKAKKNLYYRSVFKRINHTKETLFSFYLAFCSWPRLLIEVFIRRNMGERYYSFSTSINMVIGLALFPLFLSSAISRLYGSGIGNFMGFFLTWYVFLGAFLYMSLKRRAEIKRLPSVFDFGRVSISTGEIHPAFRNFQIGGKNADIRTIETLLEPGFFFIIGFVLWMSGQPVGLLLVISSLAYRMSYKAAYYFGDQFIMDTIDERIFNEERIKSFVDGLDASLTRGVRYYGRRPTSLEDRQQLAESFVEREEIAEAF